MMLDRNMNQLACSRRWIENNQLDGVDIIGRSHYEVFSNVPESWKEAHRRGLAGEVVRADEEILVRADGSIRWRRWEVRPWLMGDKTIGGITIMSEDVTDRVLATRALRESELRMRLAQEAAKVGAWEWGLADDSMQSSDSLWRLYGFEKSKGWQPSFEGWMMNIHPADRERIATEVREATAHGQEFEIQCRLNLPEGENERWILSRGKPIASANGRPDRYFGVVIEITEQKHAEQALRESELRMRLAQEAARV